MRTWRNFLPSRSNLLQHVNVTTIFSSFEAFVHLLSTPCCLLKSTSHRLVRSMMAATCVKTRILVLSDTHACNVNLPTQRADVAIHCGDLTEGSSLEEFHSALRLLKTINAPLKLVIPGNHDFTMDHSAYEAKVAESLTPLDPALVSKVYGARGEAEAILESASSEGIVLLGQGVHTFQLANGATLAMYASAYTPSLGAWGFQYHPDKGHEFQIPDGIDVVMTHGPPKGIMDLTDGRERAGCPDLFAAVARSRPRLHCFGHIHEGWGARLVTWKDDDGKSSHFSSIDNEKSTVVAKLSSLSASKFDTPEDTAKKQEKRRTVAKDRCFLTSHCTGDELPISNGVSTLFVNAAVCGSDGIPSQNMWLIDLDLQRSQ